MYLQMLDTSPSPQHRFGDVARIAGGKTDPQLRTDLRDALHQIGEGDELLLLFFRQAVVESVLHGGFGRSFFGPPPTGRNRRSVQERNLLVTLFDELSCFLMMDSGSRLRSQDRG